MRAERRTCLSVCLSVRPFVPRMHRMEHGMLFECSAVCSIRCNSSLLSSNSSFDRNCCHIMIKYISSTIAILFSHPI